MVTANQPARTGAASAAGPPSAPREHAQRNSHAHAFALEGVLQPDFTFTAPPLLQMLHGQLFACCAMLSLVFLATSLPFAGPTTPKAPGTWLKVLLPLILYTVASIGVHCAYIGSRRRALRMQLGPEPDASITVAAASVQWAVLHRCFSRQHAASNASDIVFLAGVLCSLGIVLASLQASGSAAYRAAAIPLAVAEFLVLCIHTVYRVRRRGPVPTASMRSDILVIFVFLVAFKLGDNISISWIVVFIFAFWWLVGFVVVGVGMMAVAYVGMRARLWPRGEVRARIGIALLHFGYAFLLVAAVYLYVLLSNRAGLFEARGAARLRVTLRWAGVWLVVLVLSHALIYLGQAEREARREAQMAAGRVWTRADELGHSLGAAAVQQQVDSMSEAELARKAAAMMRGNALPARLYRVDLNLWATAPKAAQIIAAQGEHLTEAQAHQKCPWSKDSESGSAQHCVHAADVRGSSAGQARVFAAKAAEQHSCTCGGVRLPSRAPDASSAALSESACDVHSLRATAVNAPGDQCGAEVGDATDENGEVASPSAHTECAQRGGSRTTPAESASNSSVSIQVGNKPQVSAVSGSSALQLGTTQHRAHPEAVGVATSGVSDCWHGHGALRSVAPSESAYACPCGAARREVVIEMASASNVAVSNEDEDDGLCIICFEHTADHVLLACGHGGFCRLCALKLLVRPPHHCPTCRTLLEGAVRVPAGTQIGGHADVRAPG